MTNPPPPPITPGPADEPYQLANVMPATPRRRRWPWVAGAAVALVVLGTAAAGYAMADREGDNQAVAAATTAPPATYRDVVELRDALKDTPGRCTDFKVIPNPTGARERAHCTDSTTLGIYDSRADAYASAQEMSETIHEMLDQRSFHIVGENWTVNCGDDTYLCQHIKMALGGEMVGS